MVDDDLKPKPLSQGQEAAVLDELAFFAEQCEAQYQFNNKWDLILTIGGILVGVGVVSAGAYEAGRLAAILGAVLTAVVSAQRAFPFGQRAQFYRALIGQASNLQTDIVAKLTTTAAAACSLKSLRRDFAPQLPPGTGSTAEATLANPYSDPAPVPSVPATKSYSTS
jgi:hypothetical protein